MAMCKALEKHGFLLEKTEKELYEIVDAAMSIAAWRNPKQFQNRRDGIAKNLFSSPEDVIGSCYQKSHCTAETTAHSAVTKDSVPQNLKTVGDNSAEKSQTKIKIRIKQNRCTTTNSKQDEKKKVDERNETKDKKNIGVSTVKSPDSVASNLVKNISNNDALIDEKKNKVDERKERKDKETIAGVSMVKYSPDSVASNLKKNVRNNDALFDGKKKVDERNVLKDRKNIGVPTVKSSDSKASNLKKADVRNNDALVDEKKKVNEGYVLKDERTTGVPTVKSSDSMASNLKKSDVRNNDALLDNKFEASKRKLEQRYKQLGEGLRKTKVLDIAEMKELIKPTRDTKRPRFCR